LLPPESVVSVLLQNSILMFWGHIWRYMMQERILEKVS
jgi:hypothetical protein